MPPDCTTYSLIPCICKHKKHLFNYLQYNYNTYHTTHIFLCGLKFTVDYSWSKHIHPYILLFTVDYSWSKQIHPYILLLTVDYSSSKQIHPYDLLWIEVHIQIHIRTSTHACDWSWIIFLQYMVNNE